MDGDGGDGGEGGEGGEGWVASLVTAWDGEESERVNLIGRNSRYRNRWTMCFHHVLSVEE